MSKRFAKRINKLYLERYLGRLLIITVFCFSYEGTVFAQTGKSQGFDSPGSAVSLKRFADSIKTRHLAPYEAQAEVKQANKYYELATQMEKAGKLDQAAKLYYKAAVARANIWGQYDPAVAKICLQLGKIELKQGHDSLARDWFKQNLKATSAHYGSGDYELVPVLLLLAKLEVKEKNHEDASLYYDHILSLQERKFGEDDKESISTRIHLAEELLAAKEFTDAKETIQKGLDIEEKHSAVEDSNQKKLKQLLTLVQAAEASNSSK